MYSERVIEVYDEAVDLMAKGATMPEIEEKLGIGGGSLRVVWDKYRWLKKNWRFTGRVIHEHKNGSSHRS